MVGDDLAVLAGQQLTDLIAPGQVSHEIWITTVTADGSVRLGTKVPMVEGCCGERWTMGPDGIAYAVVDGDPGALGIAESGQLTAVDPSGVRPGWPVQIDGVVSEPAFGPGGQAVVTVGSAALGTSRVLGFSRDGKAASVRSSELPIATVESGDDCIAGSPRTPIVGRDGKVFVYGELDTAIFALDESLATMRGWPFKPATSLERPDPSRGEEGLNCVSLARPAVGPDSTLYLPLSAPASSAGGSIVSVGPDGHVRAGWPVVLQRPGAEVWSVDVGSDGTVYALAVEPESGGASSATVLAIAPDSTVLWTATIIEP